MRKLYILTVAVLAIIVSSCSSTKKPEGTAQLYLKALKNQEFYEAAKLQLQDRAGDPISEANVLRDNLSTNPIKKFSILGMQQLSDDRAMVAAQVSWVNPTMNDCIITLPVTKQNGEWYVGEPAKPEVAPQMDYDAYAGEATIPTEDLEMDFEGASNDDFEMSDGD